jgi:acyl-CoA reductase-like NAD-dependent aldehyde dehydrogenase
VLGGANPVSGPYFNFTVPEPVGVVATIAPAEPSLEGIVSRILPAVVSGNTVVAVASQASPLAAIELAEAFATSDMPGGAVNILTGDSTELGPVLAGHMDVNALDITGAEGDTAELERLAAGNVKRIVRGLRAGESLWEIEPLLEMKTVWHPIGT